MSTADWTNGFTLQFIESYQGESILWDPAHPHYKDRSKVNDAWIRLSKNVGVPVAEIKKKKDSLMATFRGHSRKKKASFKSGASMSDIYKPIWFAFDVMEAFLGPIYDIVPNNIYKTTKTENATEPDPIDLGENQKRNEEIGEAVTIHKPPASTTTRPTVRRRGNPPEIEEATQQMKQAFNILNSVLSKKKQAEEDECDLFAKILAKKLRKLPENERYIFMYKIDGMYINRTRRHNQLQTQTNPHSSCINPHPNQPSPSNTSFSDPSFSPLNVSSRSPSSFSDASHSSIYSLFSTPSVPASLRTANEYLHTQSCTPEEIQHSEDVQMFY